MQKRSHVTHVSVVCYESDVSMLLPTKYRLCIKLEEFVYRIPRVFTIFRRKYEPYGTQELAKIAKRPVFDMISDHPLNRKTEFIIKDFILICLVYVVNSRGTYVHSCNQSVTNRKTDQSNNIPFARGQQHDTMHKPQTKCVLWFCQHSTHQLNMAAHNECKV